MSLQSVRRRRGDTYLLRYAQLVVNVREPAAVSVSAPRLLDVSLLRIFFWCVCVYYCRTYYKAVCGGGGGQ